MPQHDHHERRDVQKHDEPRPEPTVERRAAPHRDADDGADRHGQCKGRDHPQQRGRQVIGQLAALPFARDDLGDGEGRGQDAGIGLQPRQREPEDDQPQKRDREDTGRGQARVRHARS